MPERCHYCDGEVYPPGSPGARRDPGALRTRDHVIPVMMGDSGTPGEINVRKTRRNVVTACEDCNAIKGDAPVEAFLFFLRTYPQRASRAKRHLAFRQFIYSLSRVGLAAALAEHARHQATIAEAARPRGRYTLKDLRRGR